MIPFSSSLGPSGKSKLHQTLAEDTKTVLRHSLGPWHLNLYNFIIADHSWNAGKVGSELQLHRSFLQPGRKDVPAAEERPGGG